MTCVVQECVSPPLAAGRLPVRRSLGEGGSAARSRRPSSRILTRPSETRVWGSQYRPSGRFSCRPRSGHGTATGSTACGYKNASGRRGWPNRDPLGYAGVRVPTPTAGGSSPGASSSIQEGINLYGYVANNPINSIDPLGLDTYRFSGGFLVVYPSSWKFWRKPVVYAGTPDFYRKILRDAGIEDAAVDIAAALFILELEQALLNAQQQRQTPPTTLPKPPGWNDDWKWNPPTGDSAGNWRWFDPRGGEWRYHPADKWHTTPHWDYNPWDSFNSPWRNVPLPPPAPPTSPVPPVAPTPTLPPPTQPRTN
jgi:hypothetical protein